MMFIAGIISLEYPFLPIDLKSKFEEALCYINFEYSFKELGDETQPASKVKSKKSQVYKILSPIFKLTRKRRLKPLPLKTDTVLSKHDRILAYQLRNIDLSTSENPTMAELETNIIKSNSSALATAKLKLDLSHLSQDNNLAIVHTLSSNPKSSLFNFSFSDDYDEKGISSFSLFLVFILIIIGVIFRSKLLEALYPLYQILDKWLQKDILVIFFFFLYISVSYVLTFILSLKARIPLRGIKIIFLIESLEVDCFRLLFL